MLVSSTRTHKQSSRPLLVTPRPFTFLQRAHAHPTPNSPLVHTLPSRSRSLSLTFTPTLTPTQQWAHSDVVRWASLNSLVANTFLGFFFAPLVGDLSDRVGRKPFMLLGITLAVLPIGTVWLHLSYATSYLW